MPDRPHLNRALPRGARPRRARSRLLSSLAGAALVLAGCSSGELSVAGWERPAHATGPCATIHDGAPVQVAEQEQRAVSGDQALAWGDPAIVLRCGVAEPEDLEPTSLCHQIGEIGWFAEQIPGADLFTTIGREFFVSVEVPEDYEPAAEALIDLASVIAEHNPEIDPCV